MWFIFSLIALLCWSGSDLFSKLGCRAERDTLSHLKMVSAVGLVMGLHAAYELIFTDVPFTAAVLVKYLPVSALYILSMAIGYLGLRYIELSISSPVCNCSGAIVAILLISVDGVGEDVPPLALAAVALVCMGVIALGITEAGEDEELRAARQAESNRRYTKSRLALALPIIYCLLDALGTFADARVLETMDETAANVAYELTFFAVGAVCAVYVFCVRGERIALRAAAPRLTGAVCETAGQFFYILALADSAHAALSAPIISSYCAVSVVWSRIFLREKLSKKHYLSLVPVFAGILLLGILDL